jgi:predicted GNAT superfamily acetyltransferase
MLLPAERVLPDGTLVRDLASQAELEAAVALQELTWGEGFRERVPSAILLVAQKLGGIAAGAFAPDGELVGFVFGMTGVRGGQIVHWSDMLAVRPEWRGRGVGQALKQFQRDRCRTLGVETMHWTFDPLAARNARLNLNRLGARVDEFVVDMYGSHTGSPLHELGTDRFVVSWPVSSKPVSLPGDEALLEGAPRVAGPPGLGPAAGDPLPDAGSVAVLVPGDHTALLAGDPARARAWHAAVRRALAHYLGRGWRVSAFAASREGGAGYVLARPAAPDAPEPRA